MDTVNDLLARGTRLIQDKKYDEAHDALRQVVEQDPKNKLGWLLLGNSYLLEGNHEQALQIFEQADKAFPDDAIINMSIGGSLRMLGRIDEAESFKSRAQTLDPTAFDNVILLKKHTDITNLVDLEKPEESLVRLTNYLKENPATEPSLLKIIAEGFYRIGRACSRKNKPEQAEKALNQATDVLKTAIGLDPADTEVYVALGDVFYYLDEKTQAFDQYKISLSKSPSIPLAESVLNMIGESLKRYQDVLDILTIQPDLVSPLKKETLTGDAESRLEHYEKAAEAYERALLITPDDVSIHESLADTYRQLKDDAKARQEYDKAVELTSKRIIDLDVKIRELTAATPGNSSDETVENDLLAQFGIARQTLGQLEYKIGSMMLEQGEDLDEAWIHWQETVRFSPNSGNTREIAKKLYDGKRWEKASEAYTAYWENIQSQDITEDYASVQTDLGICHFFLFNYEKARGYFEGAKRINTTNRYYAHYWIGECYTYERNFKEAENHFRQAFRLEPDAYFIIEGLVVCLTTMRKKDEALAVCRRAQLKYADAATDEKEKQQRSAELFYLTGNLHLELRELDDAIRNYEEALKKDRRHVFARHNLAHLLEKQGKYALARSSWSDAKELYQYHLENPQ